MCVCWFSGGFNDPDMLVVGLDGMYPYGVVQTCPEHVKGCKPGDYISRERWGKVRVLRAGGGGGWTPFTHGGRWTGVLSSRSGRIAPACTVGAPSWQVGGLTVTEQRTHFALWCMVAAPLILGNDPRRMSKTTLSILTAPEVLAISQDPLGKQATKVRHPREQPRPGAAHACLLACI